MYKLQSSKYHNEKSWEDFPIEISTADLDKLSDLNFWIEEADNLDHYDGKYSYRIIDAAGKVVWSSTPPYEPTYIDETDEECEWMEDIRRSYYMSTEFWCNACKVYLERYGEKKDA